MEVPLGIYYHYKDTEKLYEVIGVGLHTETEEELVIYRPLYESEHALFARPVSMFLEEVNSPEYGYTGPRFTFVRPL